MPCYALYVRSSQNFAFEPSVTQSVQLFVRMRIHDCVVNEDVNEA